MMRRVFEFLASYGLACVLFLLMLVLTFFGTVEQRDLGLYEVQQRYFHSWFVVHWLGDVIPLPLPGASLLLSLLLVNLVCGGVVRMRKDWARVGVLVCHLGVAMLLVGGFVKFLWSQEGYLTLFEGQQSNQFESYHEWEVAIFEAKEGTSIREYLIHEGDFAGLDGGAARTFSREELPFDLTLSGYVRNCMPKQAEEATNLAVEGFLLDPRAGSPQAEYNLPGLRLALKDKATGNVQTALLWGGQRFPFATEAGGKVWAVDLRRRLRSMPFTVVLDKFVRELHPRTDIARVFRSDVTRIDNGIEQPVKISMNAPLRYKGYTLYQASWGPADAGLNDPLYSTLAVVRDPAERWPMYASVVTMSGLLAHFALRLLRYLRKSAAARGVQ